MPDQIFSFVQERYAFAQESFYLQDILRDINERDTSFLDCKHKHMMKYRAPPGKFGVLYHLLPIEFNGLKAIHFSDFSPFGSWIYLGF